MRSGSQGTRSASGILSRAPRSSQNEMASLEQVFSRLRLGAGFQQAEEGVPCPLAGGGAGLAGDPALGDEAADIVLRAVGVQRDLGSVKHPQQLILVGVGPGSSSSTKPVTRVKIRSKRCFNAVRRMAVGSSL